MRVLFLHISGLRCLRCGRRHGPTPSLYVCGACGGKLEVLYDYQSIELSRRMLEKRAGGVWKYPELLPVRDPSRAITLGEGGTPLVRAKRLGEKLGLKRLFLKDETRNPTGSFKDRLMSIGTTKALEFGAEGVVTASSGNAAVSLAAYAAKAGLKCYAFVPEKAPQAKIAQISIHGAKVVKVRAKRRGDPTYELMLESWKRFGWHPIPSAGAFNPYHWEGAKTISYEICEQLGWKAPDWLVVPTGAGTLLSGCAKGFFEFQRLGLVKGVPKIACVQAKGCAPVVKAFNEKTPYAKIKTWTNPKTVAGGLVDPFPWDADTAIEAIEKSRGTAVAVGDREILEAERNLARLEGIFAEPSGAAGIASLRELVEAGLVAPSDLVVILVTGGGLKDVAVALRLSEKPKEVILDPLSLARILRAREKPKAGAG
jgi:threonine synthase